jgi:hypothetical protein
VRRSADLLLCRFVSALNLLAVLLLAQASAASPIPISCSTAGTSLPGTTDVICPNNCISGGSVWGCFTDGYYIYASSVCRAAIHQGVIPAAIGGRLIVTVSGSRSSYCGGTQNGVTTSSYGFSYPLMTLGRPARVHFHPSLRVLCMSCSVRTWLQGDACFLGLHLLPLPCGHLLQHNFRFLVHELPAGYLLRHNCRFLVHELPAGYLLRHNCRFLVHELPDSRNQRG